MSEKRFKALQEKMTDFSRFSIMLVCLSAFVSIGTVIPFAGKTGRDQLTLGLLSLILIGFALFFYKQVAKIKKQLEREQ